MYGPIECANLNLSQKSGSILSERRNVQLKSDALRRALVFQKLLRNICRLMLLLTG
jgi:hypothetical protein